MPKFVLRENSGNLFKAADKDKPEDRDYRGELNVDGREFWVSAWIKQGKHGKFMSLAVKPKDAVRKPETSDTKPSVREDLNDEIPF
jgi:hypothetical protein